ncbi:MAG: GNAT family N-acetyltransferase [Chloroflexi bacterium]|nr:GNAT family N-acetyltransferase [Chloroflexota bacterium]
MPLPGNLDRDALVFLERHEARAHALPGRQIRELGDAFLLLDPLDREPFWNRVGAVRWPDDRRAFDRRLTETIALFATLDRIPHLWPRPALNEPVDLVGRLAAEGWQDVGAGYLMLLADPGRLEASLAARRDAAVTVERLHGLTGRRDRQSASDASRVLAEAFDVAAGRQASLELEILSVAEHDEMHLCLVRVAGEPAAVARRTTFDGASFLSSIGTRPSFRGRGLGRLATAVVAGDAMAEGSRWTYLGVHADNEPALRLYRDVGFEPIGDPAPDLLLR